MKYRNLGKSGLKLSELSFGAWVTFGNQIGNEVAKECMHVAYDNGVNFFDNAEGYAEGKAEIVMGEILKEAKWDRSTYVLSSKVFWGGKKPNQEGLSRKHIFDACHAALKRLQTDYIDLFFCHRPDESTPIEETVRAMSDLIHQGKVLYWGSSEWTAQQIMEAYCVAREFNLIPPTMEQPQYNLLEKFKVEIDYKRLYSTIGLGTTVWSPLASGLLTGKYNNAQLPTDSRISAPGMDWIKQRIMGDEGKLKIEKVKKLMKIAEEANISIIHLSIAWCLKNSNVSTVILGASKTEQLINNLKSIEYVDKIDDDLIKAINEVTT